MENYIDNIQTEIDIIAEKLENIKHILIKKNDNELSFIISIIIFLTFLEFKRDLNIVDKFKK